MTIESAIQALRRVGQLRVEGGTLCCALPNPGPDTARQDEVITALEEGKATEFTWPAAQAFFNTVRTHTIEDMFADPIYGGNKDFAGWRLVGFPGAQAIFTTADMQIRQAFTRSPMLGLQAQAKDPKQGA